MVPANTPDRQAKKFYNGLQLAYVGDSVFDLMVRTHLLAQHDTNVKRLHRAAVDKVNAASQAKLMHALLPLLTEEEVRQALKGRNAKPHTLPKHADAADYAWATALEALFGHLYLTGQKERLEELFAVCLQYWDDPDAVLPKQDNVAAVSLAQSADTEPQTETIENTI